MTAKSPIVVTLLPPVSCPEHPEQSNLVALISHPFTRPRLVCSDFSLGEPVPEILKEQLARKVLREIRIVDFPEPHPPCPCVYQSRTGTAKQEPCQNPDCIAWEKHRRKHRTNREILIVGRDAALCDFLETILVAEGTV